MDLTALVVPTSAILAATTNILRKLWRTVPSVNQPKLTGWFLEKDREYTAKIAAEAAAAATAAAEAAATGVGADPETRAEGGAHAALGIPTAPGVATAVVVGESGREASNRPSPARSMAAGAPSSCSVVKEEPDLLEIGDTVDFPTFAKRQFRGSAEVTKVLSKHVRVRFHNDMSEEKKMPRSHMRLVKSKQKGPGDASAPHGQSAVDAPSSSCAAQALLAAGVPSSAANPNQPDEDAMARDIFAAFAGDDSDADEEMANEKDANGKDDDADDAHATPGDADMADAEDATMAIEETANGATGAIADEGIAEGAES